MSIFSDFQGYGATAPGIGGDSFSSFAGLTGPAANLNNVGGNDFSSLAGLGGMDQAGGGEGGFLSGILGGGEGGGFNLGGIGSVMGGIGSLAKAWQGMQQLKMAEDMFGAQKDMYNQNSANQAQMLNTKMRDRQRARLSAAGDGGGGTSYKSVGDYMDKNTVKTKAV